MSFFGDKEIECPRCLGKGFVDDQDIKRLQKELIWLPGECAYCSGKRIINPNLLEKIPFDLSYLTTDLSEADRKSLFDSDPETLEMSRYFELEVLSFIQQVEFLHFKAQLDAKLIFDFYTTCFHSIMFDELDENELLNYIQSIIEHKRSN